ncbi:MAG: ATP-grasp ribosomal peptide maturase [Egibacteraceae bacterium]
MTSTQPTVLVLTAQFDPTADMVICELNRRDVSVFRCDAAGFPQQLELSATLGTGWSGWLRTAHRTVHLESVRSVYYRRPTAFVLPDGMTDSERRFAAAEARIGFGGVLTSLDCFWLNHPNRIADAEYKPLQLQVATGCGLRVPRTLVTNVAAEARSFAEGLAGPVVYKPLSSVRTTQDGRSTALYTTLVPADDQGDPRIELTAHLFQEWVPKAHDVRVTVVRDDCFAVEVHARHSPRAVVDWRADYASHTYHVTRVPDGVREGVAAMLSRLGLHFGAFDFVVTPEGEWVFLEINPNGQWGWLEDAAGVPISAAIADALQQGKTDDEQRGDRERGR